LTILTILLLLAAAAHFFRNGNLAMATLMTLIPLLLLLRRRLANLIIAVALLIMTAVWSLTAIDIYRIRTAGGVSFIRMLIIMLSVAALNLLSAVVLIRKKSPKVNQNI